ncbi:hypothetical protein B7L70_09565 [Vulcanisaeta sp. EB80]|uniref:hypothetical protein n=1 Tax=Vulcanisaeta sp. EB80 TaxID=1650660 RepID=UPI0009BD8F0C|nr:hypothetical protein [Vulcanisaeta sp. EB80]PLC66977.1 hypothetical protein B7L70_09565 [Vulcanisaeta sp. EB80]
MHRYRCIGELRGLVGYGLELIVRARLGEVELNETLDGLWEVLINIDYALQQAEKVHKNAGCKCPIALGN